jgi:hypothetical protein
MWIMANPEQGHTGRPGPCNSGAGPPAYEGRWTTWVDCTMVLLGNCSKTRALHIHIQLWFGCCRRVSRQRDCRKFRQGPQISAVPCIVSQRPNVPGGRNQTAVLQRRFASGGNNPDAASRRDNPQWKKSQPQGPLPAARMVRRFENGPRHQLFAALWSDEIRRGPPAVREQLAGVLTGQRSTASTALASAHPGQQRLVQPPSSTSRTLRASSSGLYGLARNVKVASRKPSRRNLSSV